MALFQPTALFRGAEYITPEYLREHGIRTRTRYSACVSTSATGGSFRMLGNPCCAPSNNLASIDGGAAPVPATRGAVSK
mgnify:CR=1 FL=1